MRARRGIRSLGWAALLFGAVFVRICGAADGDPKDPFTTGTSGRGYAIWSSPAIDTDGTIYVATEIDSTPKRGRIFALNSDFKSIKDHWPKDGVEVPDWVDSSPAIGPDHTLYFGCYDGNLYALNGDNGATKWARPIGIVARSSPALAPDGTIYIGSAGNPYGSNSNGEGALHAFTSAGVHLWSHAVPIEVESSPAIATDGTIIFGGRDGSVRALNPDGSLKWIRKTGDEVSSSPAIGVDGTIYIGCKDRYLYALTPDRGDIKWRYLASAEIYASPTLGPDGVVYFGDLSGNFYALRPGDVADDRRLRWDSVVNVGAPINSSAAVRGDGVVIFGANDGTLRALFTETGKLKWSQSVSQRGIVSSPVIFRSDGSIYAGAMDGKLYGFESNGAVVSAYSRWPMFRGDAAHSGRAPVVPSGGRLINLSVRAPAGEGRTLIAGLAISGAPKNYLIRGIGPGLADKGVANPLPDPSLALHTVSPDTVLLSNDNWGDAPNRDQIARTSEAVGAFVLPSESKDAVALGSLGGGLYTAVLAGQPGDFGIALIEAYDAAPADARARLVNVSTRTQAGSGEQVLTAGFVTDGPDAVKVLVRAVGPGLTAFGVPNVLAMPSMTCYSSKAGVAFSNAGWSTLQKGDVAGAAEVVGAFRLEENSADCAALVSLAPGAYTIEVSGLHNTTGEALVEVYVVP